MQSQNLSSAEIQIAFENGLINNSMTKDGITAAFIDGIVFSGLPVELRSIDSTCQGVITAIDNIEFDSSDIVNAVNSIDCSVDTAGIITAVNAVKSSVDGLIFPSNDVDTAGIITAVNAVKSSVDGLIFPSNDVDVIVNSTNDFIILSTNFISMFGDDDSDDPSSSSNSINFLSFDDDYDISESNDFFSSVDSLNNIKSDVYNAIMTRLSLNPFSCTVDFPSETIIDIPFSFEFFGKTFSDHFIFDLSIIPFLSIFRNLELLSLTILVFFKGLRMLGWAFE
ncbi:MAG: hypothetical protein P9L97_01460 [Candidatus Tenebribacter davisii]|nr:hypothetical protein [Candidatus Tenebribacter davisii]